MYDVEPKTKTWEDANALPEPAEKMTPVAPIPEVETPQPENGSTPPEEEKVTCLYCGAMSPVSHETCNACGCVLKGA